MRTSRAVALLLALAAMLGSQPRAATAAATPPILNRLDRDAEERNHEQREAWLESMHRAAPGVNWRQIEDANATDAGTSIPSPSRGNNLKVTFQRHL